MLKPFLLVTKPGIIFGNLISVIGGFFLASRGNLDLPLLLATCAGVSLVIASGCVFNNVIDRDIDGKMERTRNRPLVKGLIAPRVALAYGTLLGLGGLLLLSVTTNLLAVGLALMGFGVYVGLYSLWLKRASVYGTLVGSLSGAAPPVIGYCAVSNHFDLGAVILLGIFCLWQMPHSYAIAIFRLKDYQSAAIPVLPVKCGIAATRHHIISYILAFGLAALLLALTGFVGNGYLAVAVAVSLGWLLLGLKGYGAGDQRQWAKQLFLFSIIVITSLSVMMSVDAMAPAPDVLLTYSE